MSGQSLLPFWIALLALRLSVLHAAEPADLELLRPRQGVLLLRNGELIEGKITLAGDRYDVGLEDGEIHIKKSEVELFCRDAEQCYDRKRAHIDADKVQDHLDLAEWCLRHDLSEQAKRELKESAAIDATHPMIELLERRIKLAAEEPAAAEPSATLVTQPAPTKQLERMVREMPSGAVDTYNTTIQPLLASQCSTSGCHGPQSTGSLRLLHTSGGRPLTHRAMLLNLNSVMSVIDREHPESSLLLTAPVGPHGSCKAAIFSQRDAARYRTLVNWVNRVAGGAAADPTGSDAPANSHSQTGRSSKRASIQRSEREAEQKMARHARVAEAASVTEKPTLPVKGQSSPQPSEDSKPEPSAAKDPFDPEIFNRQTAGKNSG